MTKYADHLRLEMKNIACFHHQVIDLKSGEVTEITGGNGRGKTTILLFAKNNLQGKPCTVPSDIVTDGEDKGSAILRADNVTVERRLKRGETATELDVINEHGEVLPKAMSVLREQFGDGSCLNPVEIIDMKKAGERVKAIAAALPIDPAVAAAKLGEITGHAWTITSRDEIFEQIDLAHDDLYKRRAKARADAEAAEAQADGVLAWLPDEWKAAKGDVPKPIRPGSLGDVHDKKRDAEVRNAERAQLAQGIVEYEERIRRGENWLAGEELRLQGLESQQQTLGDTEDEAVIEEQIRLLQQQLAEMKQRNFSRRNLVEQITTCRDGISRNAPAIDNYRQQLALKQAREKELGAPEDITALQAQIDAYDDAMTQYEQAVAEHGERSLRYEQAEGLREHAKKLWAEWETLERKVKAVDHLPLDLLDGVPMPIPGMEIRGKDIYLPDGDTMRRFDAFGDADQLRFAAMMAIELAPMNVLLLDGVEKCDDERRLMLYRIIAEAGFMALSTRVTGGPLTISHLTREALNVTVGDTLDTLPVAVGQSSLF